VALSNELQQKSKHIDEMIENRKGNIGVIEKKTGDILANIDDVKDVVIKHLNEVADKMKEKVTGVKVLLSHFRCESVAPRVQQGLE
jgi:hypothetical protein